ncbi:MAG: hypothetical protein GX421_04170 [Caldisericales bacterium]|nr:hypothetical protein [Caldisericales bacterium]
MKQNGVKLSTAIMLAFAVGIVSYFATAFFINAWPFEKIKQTTTKDLLKESGSQDGSLEGLFPDGKGTYGTSDGLQKVFDGFSIAFPDKWLYMRMQDSGIVTGVDSLDPMASVQILKISDKDVPEGDPEKALDEILKTTGSKIEILSREKVKFLDKDCSLFLGKTSRMDREIGMITLVVPGKNDAYIVMGTFDADDNKTKETIENVIATFRLE